MTTIALTFLAGRFHATPWGRHVNEGAPEWPPSPWRLLRALIAAWKIRSDELSESDVRPLLEALVEPPEFVLPPASLGHTRHYMPIGYSKGVEKTTKVFDAFVSIPSGQNILIRWPLIDLEPLQREILSRLLGRLTYVGRSESWCDARLVEEDASNPASNCRPLRQDEHWPQAGKELVRVLCPDPETAFSDEQARPRKGRPVYDPVWNIAIETGQLHKERWSDAPGSRWLSYVRDQDCLQAAVRKPRRPEKRSTLQIARYALDSKVLPLTTAALPLAERVRAALMSCAPNNLRSAVFSGKEADGTPREGHRHAYFLPTDEDGDGRVDHVTVFALAGFGEVELRAIDKLSRLTPRGNEHEIRLLLLGIAAKGELSAPLLCPAREWVSATPYLATRHPKRKADRRAFLEEDLRRELVRFAERTQSPPPQKIISLVDEAGVFRLGAPGGAQRRPLEFKRFRSGKSSDDGGRRLSGFYRLIFPTPVEGPISLGHSSHFGMGLFVPADQEG